MEFEARGLGGSNTLQGGILGRTLTWDLWDLS